jgi:hypothetical protein
MYTAAVDYWSRNPTSTVRNPTEKGIDMPATAAYDKAIAEVVAKGGKKVTLQSARPKRKPVRPVQGAAAKIEQDSRAKTAAIRAGKLTKKERGTGNGGGPNPRLTMEWTGKDRKDVKVKDRVRMKDGTVIDVIGRWTKRKKDGTLAPFITGHIVSTGEDTKAKKSGDRQNAAAAEVTHVK